MTCTRCHRAMRPLGGLAADYPGTVSYQAKGQCSTCYRWVRREERLDREAWRRMDPALQAWILDRRERLKAKQSGRVAAVNI